MPGVVDQAVAAYWAQQRLYDAASLLVMEPAATATAGSYAQRSPLLTYCPCLIWDPNSGRTVTRQRTNLRQN